MTAVLDPTPVAETPADMGAAMARAMGLEPAMV